MKAVILAAGKGRRLGSLTDNTPKSMLGLNVNHTLLSFNLKQLSDAGIDSMIMVIGYQAQKLEQYALKLAKNYGISIEFVYNPFWDHCNVLGSLYMALGKIDDDFIFLHADTIFEIAVLDGLISSKSEVCLAADFKLCGEEEMKIWLEGKRISRITKCDIGYAAQGEFVGVAKFSRHMESYFIEKSQEIFQFGVLDSYMEQVLDNGLVGDNLTVDYFDVSSYKTIEVDFSEDLALARSMFID